jgi:hypothetical protein
MHTYADNEIFMSYILIYVNEKFIVVNISIIIRILILPLKYELLLSDKMK